MAPYGRGASRCSKQRHFLDRSRPLGGVRVPPPLFPYGSRAPHTLSRGRRLALHLERFYFLRCRHNRVGVRVSPFISPWFPRVPILSRGRRFALRLEKYNFSDAGTFAVGYAFPHLFPNGSHAPPTLSSERRFALHLGKFIFPIFLWSRHIGGGVRSAHCRVGSFDKCNSRT